MNHSHPEAHAGKALSELERDALTELVNIAISGSAVRLRQMVGSEVTLTVPNVTIVDSGEAVDTMLRLGLLSLVAVQQSFDGELCGRTLLVFPQESYVEITRAVVGDDVSEEEFADIAQDALAEIGNILLLGFLSTLGNMLGIGFNASTPVVSAGAPVDIFGGDRQEVVLFVYVNFTIRNRSVRGYFSLILGVGTFDILQGILQRFIAEIEQA